MAEDSTSEDEQPEVDDRTLSEVVRRPTRTAGDLAAAQQEVTRRLMPVGYQPAGRWSPVETSRTFKPGEPPRGKPVPRRRVLNTAREWGM
jgi:hypothetical protein